jgi:SAM-dependent methyltransferase
MRETFRNLDNKSYWEKRWNDIEVDDPMINKNEYPLKYAIKTINYQDKEQKILEAGCGAGRILKYFYYKKYNITGIDFIECAIKKIINSDKKINAFRDDILKTRFKNEEFDTILAFGLYHNFQKSNFIKALIETKRILKQGGILCFSFRSDNLQNFILDKIKNENSNPDINKKFHKLNLKENEIIEILKENKLKILEKKYVTNMPLLFHFKIFRSNDQKTFNEHLGRKNGYTLNFFGRLLNKFLITFFKKKYCNIYIFYVTKL